jgi:hypothetical protein
MHCGSLLQHGIWSNRLVSQEDIDQQLKLLKAYRRRLAHDLEQQAIQGVDTSFKLEEDICDARDHIRRIKEVLRSWHIHVEDHPDDGPYPAKFTTPDRGSVRWSISGRNLFGYPDG